MDYQLPCECGLYLTVTEGSAGARLPCTCGKVVVVPSLVGLKMLAGQHDQLLSPEVVIEQLLLSGGLPPTDRCVHCGESTKENVTVRVECERAQVRSSESSLLTHVLGILFLHWWYLLYSLIVATSRAASKPEDYGHDKLYSLPLPLCPSCRPTLTNAAAVRSSIQRVDEYRRLLEKFPEAKVEVEAG